MQQTKSKRHIINKKANTISLTLFVNKMCEICQIFVTKMCEISKIFVNIFGKLLKTNYFCNDIFLDYETKYLQQTSGVEKQAVGKA